MDAERDKREEREILFIERYSPVILQTLVYGAVDKIKLNKTLFPNWRHILAQNKYTYCKTSPHCAAVGIMS